MTRGMHAGSLLMERDGTVSGMIAGDVEIAAGRHVRVSGMVAGDLIVGAGAVVTVTGMVGGRVIAPDAHVDIQGMVAGRGGMKRSDR